MFIRNQYINESLIPLHKVRRKKILLLGTKHIGGKILLRSYFKFNVFKSQMISGGI